MKTRLIIFSILLTSLFSLNAQTKTFSDLVNYDVKNLGTMMGENNNVEGYYNFFEGEKLKKKKRQYIIQLLDENLNVIVKKNYIDSKYINLIAAKYNQQELMFCFYNTKEKQYKFVGFDKKGNQKEPYIIQLDNKDILTSQKMLKLGQKAEFLSIKDKGFVFKYFKKEKKMGYILDFIPTNGSEKWTYGTDPKSKANEYISFAGTSEKGISFYLFSRKSMLSNKITVSSKVINTTTGKLILNSKTADNKEPILLSNTFFENDSFINVGEYFSDGEDVLKDESNGLIFSEYDYNGKLITSKKTSWNNPILGKFKKTNNKKNKNHLFFHEIIKTNTGEYYAITESYRRSASAAGITTNILSIAAAATGRGGGGMVGNTKLTITDSYFIKLDKDYNLTSMDSFKKGKTYATCWNDFGSATINAQLANQLGNFDYLYSQKNDDKNRFYSLFTYKQIVKKGKDIPVVKSVTYNDGTFSEDVIKLKNGKTTSLVLPAKAQHVLLLDYNAKKKTMLLHLEKFNIE